MIMTEDETRQKRLEHLREAEAQGTLVEAERAELAALIQERCRDEEAAVMGAAQRAKEANALLEARVQQVLSRSHGRRKDAGAGVSLGPCHGHHRIILSP